MAHVAVDLGATKVALRLSAADGNVDSVLPLPALGDGAAELEFVVTTIGRALADATEDVAAIGVAAAPVLGEDGRVVAWPNRPQWVGLSLRDALAALAPVPLVIEDDGTAAALADAAVHAERDLVSLSIGTGIGGGIVAGDAVLRGARGAAGDLGHVVVDASGPRCACGRRGCVQAIASGPATLRRAAAAAGRPIAGAALEAGVRDGEAWAQDALAPTVRALTTLLVILRAVVDPAVVCLGGGFATTVTVLVELLRDAAAEVVPGVRVAPSPCGERAALEGAALLARRAVCSCSD